MFWLFLLFIVAPLLELYVIIQVASVIGGWQTIALLVIESAIGAYLLKHQGRAALDKISRALNEGRIPSNELIDGLLLLVAGSLMLGYFKMSLRAIFHAFWTIHDSDRSCRAASSWISLSICSGK